MTRRIFSVIIGVSTGALLAASVVSAQSGAPRVRLSSVPTTRTSFGNINSALSLSDNAYILAVAIDRDGQVSVLSPELPNDIIRFEASNSIRLPEFFSGFSTASSSYYPAHSGYYNASYMQPAGFAYSNGSVLVVASKTPLNFAAISQGIFWNEESLAKLIRYRSPSAAVLALGRAVTQKGQSFGHDYMNFGGNNARFASYAGINDCYGSFSRGGFGYGGFASYFGVNSFHQGGYVIQYATASTPGLRLVNLGSDECGRPRFVVLPYTLNPAPEKKPDSVVKESGKFRSASTGTYTGDDVRRVVEELKRGGSSEGYSRVATPLITTDAGNLEGAIPGRPVTREVAPANADQGFERVRSYVRPVERQNPAPVEHAAPVVREQPVVRESRPIVQSEPRVRYEKPVEVVSAPPPTL